MAVLKNPRWEQFAQLIAGGATYTEAYTSVGYEKKNAPKSGKRLSQNPLVCSRIDELCSVAATAKAEQNWLHRNYVLSQLKVVVERALEQKKYGDVNQALRLLGLELGMFREGTDHTFRWDGDPRSLDEKQLATLRLALEQLAFAGDQAARDEELKLITAEVEREMIQ